MKFNFRKITSALASTVMVGSTVALAAAASFPAPFVDNGAADVTVVYGSTLDTTAMTDITTALSAALSAQSDSGSTTLEGAEGVTEDEVVLGGLVNFTNSNVETTMTDSDIPTLLDMKISWDDGLGNDDYDIHEELKFVGDMAALTSLNDEDLTGVALSNNMALEYRYVFDDAFSASRIGMENATGTAEDLFLTILGQEYEITAIAADSITVVTSETFDGIGIGGSVTVDGVTFTVEDLSSDAARINGVTVSEGSSRTIDGLKVEVDADSIFYNENFPDQASLTLKIGDDISKTYEDGDEYIGEDEDDPLWVWEISTATSDAGYIGVSYNVNINDADDSEAGDSIKYAGEGYMFPDNFAEVTFDGLTEVEYEDFTVKFTEKDLYNSVDAATAAEDKDVIVISGLSTDSITLNGSEETNEIYIYHAANTSATNGTVYNYSSIELFYKDHDGDNNPTNKARYQNRWNLTGASTLARTNIATMEVGDSVVDIDMTITLGVMTLHFENPDNDDTDLTIGGVVMNNTVGTLVRLGATAEDADANDIKVDGNDVSTKEESIMDYYGIIVGRDDSGGVEGNADSDEVTLSVPSDKVYATVSVVAGGDASTDGTATLGSVSILDSDLAASGMSGNNLIVVGGSCVNSVAADLLGVSAGTCGSGWSAATGLGEGDYVVQTFAQSDGKVATLVAGWSQEDTASAATFLANGANVMTDANSRYVNGASA